MPTLLCLVALSLLSLKLPGVSELLGLKDCASCSTITPYIPMLAASYFAFLLAATLCFRSFPAKAWKWGGLIWAIDLGISLTLLNSQVCWICLKGNSIKPFKLGTTSSNDLRNYEGIIFHFVSPSCPYCKEQLPQLNWIAKQYAGNKYRFITISQKLTTELIELGNHLEWIEDDSLASAFGVQGFPTLVMVNGSGKVI